MYPRFAGSNPVYNGLTNVPKNSPVYLIADTAGGVTSFAWTLQGPSGFTATLNSTNTQTVQFTPDLVGDYVVNLTVNGGSTDAMSFNVGTFVGISKTTDCEFCHTNPDMKKWSSWKETPHANIFQEGVTGELEVAPVNGQMMGVYSVDRCAKCHTTGSYNTTADNGNFGFIAHQTGWDTTWYKTFTLDNGEYLIPQGDQTAWNLFSDAKYSSAMNVATIGCESCHGPVSKHITTADPSKVNTTLDASVCLACHDAPTHHTIGIYYEASVHAKLPNGEHTAQTGCFPCHSGGAYVKYAKNQATPGWTAADGDVPISCAVCHDPHEASNFGLRLVPVTLANGYSVTTGGNGQLCMTCHQSRKNINTTITDQAPYYGFGNRFGPHHGPQADMLLGQNAYQYDNAALTGLNTHGSLKDACVTCHMADIGSGMSASHQWGMVDTTGGTAHDFVTACKSCHGDITSFDDIKASSDLDGNGSIDGIQTEVRGMLDNLASLLPKDADGNVVSMLADSAKVKDHPEIVKGIYTYFFVEEDKSMGVHNAKYTVAILQAALNELGYVVPVELSSFNAAVSANKVSLTWETVTENNNKGFVVERKVSDKWQEVGFVNGRGTSTEINKYSFTDKLDNVSASKIVYRLKQVDFNGTFKYSKEVNVTPVLGPKEYVLDQNYPNPFNPTTTIKYSLPYTSNVKLVVYNLTGEVVKVLVSGSQESGSHQIVMNTSGVTNMSSGVYFYSLEATSVDGSNVFRQTKKMILLK